MWTEQTMSSQWKVSLSGACSYLCYRAQGLAAQAGGVSCDGLSLMVFSRQLTYNKQRPAVFKTDVFQQLNTQRYGYEQFHFATFVFSL